MCNYIQINLFVNPKPFLIFALNIILIKEYKFGSNDVSRTNTS